MVRTPDWRLGDWYLFDSMYSTLGVLTLFVHLLFIAFCVMGGLACLSNSRWVYVHIPTLTWGAATEFFGLVCPLTYLENYFLIQAGETVYAGDFVGRYLLAVIYPEGLTRFDQMVLGCLLLATNIVIYWVVWRRSRSNALQ